MLKLEKAMPEFLKYTEAVIDKNLHRDTHIGFNAYSPAYLMTTENINGYYDLMDFNGKSILTVIGASDHIFNAILRGAKKVDGFDISIYAIMFYYLKEAAIKALDYQEYIKFFYDSKNWFNKKTFAKIFYYLNPISVSFWTMIFSKKDPANIINSSKTFFLNFKHLSYTLDLTIKNQQKISAYLEESCYYKTKENLKSCEVRIFLRDVKALDDIDGKYDYIILSNIKDYQNPEVSAFDYAIERYLSKLNPGGEIEVAYMYNEPTERDLEKYFSLMIPSYSKAIYGYGNNSNYVLTKKRV